MVLDIEALMSSCALSLQAIDAQYCLYQKDPHSLDAEWKTFFDALEKNGIRDSLQDVQKVSLPIATSHSISIDQKKMILQHLNKSELFEIFLQTKYVGQKRFSLQGGETLIPMLAALIDSASSLGTQEFYIGMSHRGRINVLGNILEKPYSDVFAEFDESYIPSVHEGSGDVRYHNGFTSDVLNGQGQKVKIVLTANPSHLESVGSVVQGQVKARLAELNLKSNCILPILIHGDGAISGQGVVYETLQMSRLEGYSTGGSIHIILNNDISFTTIPNEARSTTHCSDIAKAFDFPVFFVNAEDPESCIIAVQEAVKLREETQGDVFIELHCYRKYGHNEGDEPTYTQPLEYRDIHHKKPIREMYRDHLIQQGVIENEMANALEVEFKEELQKSLQMQQVLCQHLTNGKQLQEVDPLLAHVETAVSKETLMEIGKAINFVPPGFHLHQKLKTQNDAHLQMLEKNSLDWAMAELLAYGSLVLEGLYIRLSGQDSCRGTFSQRQAVWVDQETGERYFPLKHLQNGVNGKFFVYNSPLSEFAVLGFEFGFSLAFNEALVIWEAQFGDFVNGAQVIIDQYIASSEQKWGQAVSLTLFLPHGYEGQGPEHSSARMERFLSLAAENNMRIVNPSTPAQLFHLLRRQAKSALKKPLIVFTPKSLLRHPLCVSPMDEFTAGSFQEVIYDRHLTNSVNCKRLVLCSGKVYYDLIAEREKRNVEGMMIVRVEQLYPLDREAIKRIFAKHSSLKECIWAQEEPANMGAWNYMRPILQNILPTEATLKYVGRMDSASPAAGSYALHKEELLAMMEEMFETKGVKR